MRVGITREFHHVEALKRAGGRALITKYRLPGAAFGAGGVGRFSTLDIVETVENSLYLIGVNAFARARDERGRGCAPKRWVLKRWALKRCIARSCVLLEACWACWPQHAAVTPLD